MLTFTFYLHDGPDTIPAFEIELLDHDDDAVAHGRKLLRERSRYSALVITEGEREVARLDREARPASLAAASSIGAA